MPADSERVMIQVQRWTDSSGSRIRAIKLLRQWLHLGLADAKTMTDQPLPFRLDDVPIGLVADLAQAGVALKTFGKTAGGFPTRRLEFFVAVSATGSFAVGERQDHAERWLAEDYGEDTVVTHCVTVDIPIPIVPPPTELQGVVE